MVRLIAPPCLTLGLLLLLHPPSAAFSPPTPPHHHRTHRPPLRPSRPPRRPPPLAKAGHRLTISEELTLERQATLVELPVMFSDELETSFDFERWDSHRSPGRYGRLLFGVLFGVTTRRIGVTVALLVVFSGFVQAYASMAAGDSRMPELQLPLTPFELTAPVLGLLLVFRTNTAYDRFNTGSDASWEVTGRLRSVMRQLVAWAGGPEVTAAERAAVFELIDGCCVLHAWLMSEYLRGEEGAAEGVELLRGIGEVAARGRQAGAREACDAMQLTPWLALTALSFEVNHRLPSLEVNQRIAIDAQLTSLTKALGTCEKLLRTPIPLGYTRYSVRFLWIWLTLLPFALVSTFGAFGVGTWWEDKPKPVLLTAMLFIGFIFLSIEDIAVQIEEPFAILPLNLHRKWLDQEANQLKTFLKFVGGTQEKGKPTKHDEHPSGA
ncbi:hypothetical protein AB1Y20_005465 [Prymnesium parvum]|uniref:Bestrophin homolog n=1 Tax=Prymnesium parvum TaxID=97485 RepID=A0AB34J637_PRYPA